MLLGFRTNINIVLIRLNIRLELSVVITRIGFSIEFRFNIQTLFTSKAALNRESALNWSLNPSMPFAHNLCSDLNICVSIRVLRDFRDDFNLVQIQTLLNRIQVFCTQKEFTRKKSLFQLKQKILFDFEVCFYYN